MRSSIQILVALTVLWLTDAIAQEPADEALRELLCEQCPFDARVRVGPRSATTPEMRTLGVVTVRDMLDQLPQNAVDSPFNLGGSIRELSGINTPLGERTQRILNSRRNVNQASDDTELPSDELGEAPSASVEEESDSVTEAKEE